MRLSAGLLAFAILLPAAASAVPPKAPGDQQRTCARTTAHVATDPARHSGQQLAPRKLGELPDGRAYMAVYRQIGGCEAPLTMVDYRSGGRR